MTLEGALDATVSEDAVTFTLSVTNAGSDPVDVEFTDSGRADVAVLDDGEEIWRFTDDRLFAQVMGQECFDPGQTRQYDVEWTDPAPGSYEAVGELRSRDRPCEARTQFTV